MQLLLKEPESEGFCWRVSTRDPCTDTGDTLLTHEAGDVNIRMCKMPSYRIATRTLFVARPV